MSKSIPKISVIMPSYLSEYENCATNREEKFIRAVDSFLSQDYQSKQLVIISDGCEKTIEIIKTKYASEETITLVKLPKQPLFSGMVRQQGLLKANGDLICYLDADDLFGAKHLKTIAQNHEKEKCDWYYFNDVLRTNRKQSYTRHVELKKDSVGTSSIAHKNLNKTQWHGCDGYGHDWLFIQKLIEHYPNVKKLYGCNYQVCHVPKQFES